MFDDMLNSKFVLEFRNIMKGRVIFIHYLRNIGSKIAKMRQYKSIAFDISRYVNNKGFGYTKDDIDSDYTGIGEFIVLNKKYAKQMHLKKIILPYCLNMHIFAISLLV